MVNKDLREKFYEPSHDYNCLEQQTVINIQ